MRTFHSLLLSIALTLSQQPNKPPFRIAITAESPSIVAGADVWIKVSITNTSNQDLDDSGGFSDTTRLDPNLQFDVRDESGKLVPKRTYAHPELDTGMPINRSISPGQTLTQEQRVSALYDMRRPGKYVIQVSREIPKRLRGGTIKSNTITVSVTE